MRPIFAPEAEADLEEIANYIAIRNPERAWSFVEELRAKAQNIVHAPRAYPMRTDLAADLREAIYPPYLILFRLAGEQVQIVRILHGARDLKSLFD